MNEPKGFPVKQQVWEEQYQSGRWDYLNNIEELGRYGIISAFIHRFSERPRVLDIGGGEGILYHYLDSARLDKYVCLDLAESSFERSTVPKDRGVFVAGDMEEQEFASDELFNSVIFNEVLYFAKEPMKMLEKAASWISPSGIIVISMWHAPDGTPFRRTCDAIWQGTDTGPFKIIDETAITNVPSARVWRVRALQIGP